VKATMIRLANDGLARLGQDGAVPARALPERAAPESRRPRTRAIQEIANTKGEKWMKSSSFSMDDAMRDPAKVFRSPDAVVHARGLTQEHKLRILRHWEFDCRELLVAEEENMGGGEPARLHEVLQAMARLRAHAEDPAE
jgi:hypothetical protein